MRRWSLLLPVTIIFAVVAGCGGDEPASEVTPAASVTPTGSASVRPTGTASPAASATVTSAPPTTATPSPAGPAGPGATATATSPAGATPTPTPAGSGSAPTATRTSVPPTATPTQPPPPPTATPTPTARPQPIAVTVQALDGPFAFSPANVTIPAGSSVTWAWGGTQFHDVTSTTFASSETKKTGSHTVTFNTPGTYSYVCQVHIANNMRGTVVVQ